MNNFSYVRADTPQEALQALSRLENSRILAGGTDLVTLMKAEIANPSAVVDITNWKDGYGIDAGEDGLKIGALTPLSDIADHADVRRSYSALADACHMAATPQLRNMGSIAGNLLQQTRCWYYRGPYMCWYKGGDTCYARSGENQNHSIFLTEPSPCVSPHPSDPAAALLVLDAGVTWFIEGEEGESTLEDLYVLPREGSRSVTIMPSDGLLTGITLPPPAAGARSIYRKVGTRAAYSFPLVGVAIKVELDGGTIQNARVALSAVAPIPIRMRDVETRLDGQSADGLDLGELSTLLVEKAQPLARNGYKVTLLQGLFRQTLEELLSQDAS